MEKQLNILGLDPANKCGWAHTGPGNIMCGVWSLKEPTDKHPGRRLERIRRKLFQVKRMFPIDAIGMELATMGSKLARTQASHNELAGVIKLCAAEWDVPVFEWTPTHLKKWFTGSGRADKEQMVEAVASRYDLNVTHDAADAIAVMARTQIEFEGT